jgi:hypothetical protein
MRGRAWGWRRGMQFRLAQETLVAFLDMSLVCGSVAKDDRCVEEPGLAKRSGVSIG